MEPSSLERLLVRIDAIRGSISDPLIQSILTLIEDLALEMEPRDKSHAGFVKKSVKE